MKIKSLILAAASAIALSGAASAQTVIDLVGSTAARSLVNNSVKNFLSSGTNNTLTSYSYNNANGLGSSSAAIFKGTVGNTSNTVIIRTLWNGSLNGIQDVQQGTPQTGYYATTVTPNNSVLSTTGNTSSNATLDVPEIGYADIFNSSTNFATLNSSQIVVQPFKFFKNVDAPAGITNITSLLVQQLYGNGSAKLSLFTGSAADSTSFVRAVGRNNDSGTRIVSMAESGYGVTLSVTQYGRETGSATQKFTIAASATLGNPAYVSSFGGVSNLGPASGGTVKNYLAATTNTTETPVAARGIPFVGYLGATDWLSAPAQELTYNGAAYSSDNVKNGKYTYWGYLWQNDMGFTPGSVESLFESGLKATIQADPTATVGLPYIKLSDMTVSRDGDGAPVK